MGSMHVSGDCRSLHAANAKPEVAHKMCGGGGGGGGGFASL